jgi:hypothetical protein
MLASASEPAGPRQRDQEEGEDPRRDGEAKNQIEHAPSHPVDEAQRLREKEKPPDTKCEIDNV